MAPVPYLYESEPAPYTSPHLLQNMWRRLYPNGSDPVYQVYQERLADSVYEYHAEVTLHTSTISGIYTHSSRSGYTSTPGQAVQINAFEALVDLHYNEVQMQHHPVFFTTRPCPLVDVSVSLLLIRSATIPLATSLTTSLLVIFYFLSWPKS